MDVDKAIETSKSNLRLSGFDVKISPEGEQLIKDRLNNIISDEEFKDKILNLIKRS